MMKKYLYILFFGLLFIFIFSGNSFAKNSGHMIERFELIVEEKKPWLSLKGFFDPDQFVNIRISQGISKSETTILVPNSLINNLILQDGKIISFQEDSILKSLTFDENVSKKENGEIGFSVKITIVSKEKYFLMFDSENSNSRQLSFSIQNKKRELFSVIDETGVQLPNKIVNEFGILKKSPRQTILLHPITALMSYRKFDQLNVAVLNASNNLDAAQSLAAMLGRSQKKNIEKRMGMKLKIINISSVRENTILPRTKIYFHANLLRAALILADFIPGSQVLEPVPFTRKSKLSTDVQIYVGKNFE